MERATTREGLLEEYIEATGARLGLEAAQRKNIQVHSPTIGRQLLQRGLIDDIDIHIAPVPLGDGIRQYDAPGGDIIHLQRDGGDPTGSSDLRYRPLTRTAEAQN